MNVFEVSVLKVVGIVFPYLIIECSSRCVLFLSGIGRDRQRKIVMRICSLNEKKSGCAVLHRLAGHEVTAIGIAPKENYVFWTIQTYNACGAVVRGSLEFLT